MLMYLLKISFKDGLRWAIPILLVFAGGCGNFFEKKTTEIQTREILRQLEQPREVPGIKNPLPEMYRGESKKIQVADGIKLFYFTKHHPVEQLGTLVNQQLGNKISTNPATNQMVIHCENDEQTDTVLKYLEQVDVPPIQVNIDCMVVERFADVTFDWETTLLIENLLGEKITLGGKTDSSGDLLPTFPGAALREGARREFGLDFGYWRNQGVTGHQIRAVVDVLESRGYLKILMNPQLETVNGQKAMILSRENAPLQKIIFKAGLDEPFETTEYQWVADTLEVTPHVYADGSVGLQTKVQIGSKSKPEGVIQASIITERSVDVQENRIKPGESLIIGGLRKSEKRSVIRGIPFFKDIPVIGVLFSSKDFEEKATEIVFILTPSISSGGRPYEEVLEEVRDIHKTPDYESSWEEYITDPFGKGVYSEQVKKEAQKAELERRKAEIKRAEAMEEIKQIKKGLIESTEEVMTEKAKAAKALAEAKKAEDDAIKAKAEAEQAKKEAEAVKNALLKAQEDAEAAEKKAQAAKEAAEKTKAELEKEKEAKQKEKEQEENQKVQTNQEQ
ncbi:MAG: hypothetical protein JW804_04250 [Sedimentisphaerales bacterium]|nr:hypothetical protein [Sedimentisphaerales bacterium]